MAGMPLTPRVWTSQPQTAASVVASHRPIGGIQPGGFGLLDTGGMPLTVGTGITQGVGVQGRNAAFSGGVTLGGAVNVSGHPLTFVFAGKVDASGLHCLSSISTTADKMVRVFGFDGSMYAQHIGAITNAAAQTASVWTTGSYFACVAVFRSPTDVSVYARGDLARAKATTVTDVGALGTLNMLTIGGYNGSQLTYPLTGAISLAQWLNVAFTEGEAWGFVDNVWRLFAPSTSRIYISAAGGGGAVLASSASATPSSSAALSTAIAVAASASAVPGATASLTTSIPLAAAATARPASTAALTTTVALAAAASAAPASAAVMGTQIALASSAQATPSSIANLTAAGQSLQSAASASPSGAASLTTAIVLVSSAQATPSSTASLTALGQGLQSSASASPSGSASLTTGIALSAQASAAAAATANLLTAIALSSSAQAQASGTGSLTTGAAPWTASGMARAIGSANLTTQILLAAAASAQPGGTSNLTTSASLIVNPRRIVPSVVLDRLVAATKLDRLAI